MWGMILRKDKKHFTKQGLLLNSGVTVPIGINGKKSHSFDLGNNGEKVLVSPKAHRWTEGGNVPSAKLTVWNEAMYFFYASTWLPQNSGGIARLSTRRNETLGEYYIRTYSHLIPMDVEVWEYDESEKTGKKIK